MKKKIGFIIDGGSTLSEQECVKYNIKRIYFKIIEDDSISYNDTEKEITYQKIDESHKNNKFLKTSCTPIGEVMNAIDELLKTNDFIFIFTINKSLSSQYNSIKILENEPEYKNKIYVLDTQSQCYGLEYLIIESQKMINKNMSIDEIIKFVEKQNEFIYTSFISESSKPATASGRLSKNVIGKALDKAKLIPILNMNQKISLNSIAKNYSKAIEKMVVKMKKVLDESQNKIKFISLYTSLCDKDKKELLILEIIKEFNIKENEIIIKKTPLIIFNNTGRNSFGLAIIFEKKYKNE